MLLDTAKERVLLCSGFPGLHLFGDTEMELLLSPTHPTLANIFLMVPKLLCLHIEQKNIPTAFVTQMHPHTAGCINPEPSVKEILFEELHLELHCLVPAGRALRAGTASWLSSAQVTPCAAAASAKSWSLGCSALCGVGASCAFLLAGTGTGTAAPPAPHRVLHTRNGRGAQALSRPPFEIPHCYKLLTKIG